MYTDLYIYIYKICMLCSFVVEERICLKITEMGETLRREIQATVSNATIAELKSDVATIAADVQSLKGEWANLKADLLPNLRDAALTGVREIMRDIFQALELADPDDIRRQRKKLDQGLEKLEKKLSDLVNEAGTLIAQTLEDKNTSSLTSVTESINTCVQSVKKVAVTSTKQAVKDAVESGLKLDPGCLTGLQNDMQTLVQSVLSGSSAQSITDQVLAVIKENLNRDIATKVQDDLRTSVASIHKLLIHDIRGALDGEVKKTLEEFVAKALKQAGRDSKKATKEFFEETSRDLVTQVIASVQAALRFSPTPEDQGDYILCSNMKYICIQHYTIKITGIRQTGVRFLTV